MFPEKPENDYPSSRPAVEPKIPVDLNYIVTEENMWYPVENTWGLDQLADYCGGHYAKVYYAVH